MSGYPPDLVTPFLIAQGMRPEVACFERSEFVIGWRVRVNDLEVVYRQEGDQLVICDLLAADGAEDTRRTVASFIRLIHRIERGVGGLSAVRGMFLKTLSNPVLNRARERLAAALEAQGARWEQVDGDSWLVYPIAAGGTATG